jgi:hypothetical protein
MEEVLQVKVLLLELEAVIICNNDPLYVIDNVPVAAGGIQWRKKSIVYDQSK